MLEPILTYLRTLPQRIAVYLKTFLSAASKGSGCGSCPPPAEPTSASEHLPQPSNWKEMWLKNHERNAILQGLNWRQRLIAKRRKINEEYRGDPADKSKLFLLTRSIDDIEHDLLAMVPKGLLEEITDLNKK